MLAHDTSTKNIHYVNIYIYIYREREIYRDRDIVYLLACGCLRAAAHGARGRCFNRPFPISGKDKGGPSKGGFLNNILYSYTVLYVCNEINGAYKAKRLFM